MTPEVQKIKDIIFAADAYVIVSPEYNHTIPPALSSLMVRGACCTTSRTKSLRLAERFNRLLYCRGTLAAATTNTRRAASSLTLLVRGAACGPPWPFSKLALYLAVANR